jgi:hypothetical protein
MKIRFTNNSIRIRVSKSELERLQKEHLIEENVGLPDGATFTFALVVQEGASIKIRQKPSLFSVSIPEVMASPWMATEQVGIEVHHPLSEGQQLHILIEKDFPCAHQPHKDRSDTFNDLAEKQNKS